MPENEVINGARLTVTVLIDNDKVQDLKELGYSDKDIETLIKKSIRLKNINVWQPVTDIESVVLEKFF
jgi:hypothetical protein